MEVVHEPVPVGGKRKMLYAVNAATGEKLDGSFESATSADVDNAVQAAQKAFEIYRSISSMRKAEFLEAIAAEIMLLGDDLIKRAALESGLPEARLIGERSRTVNQLNFFSNILREGSWVEASISTAAPNRLPFPKPDLRKMLIPLGPVAVFAASNFPLAFSTAGGDTASALAAGCPVILKAHNAHLGTNDLVTNAIKRAIEKLSLPEGVFTSLVDDGYERGVDLVKHPLIKSVAFTGSYAGGTALIKATEARQEPIPVFMEMGSINPVVLLNEKLKLDAEQMASMFASSITLGAGQFCTKPGIIIGIEGEDLELFSKALAKNISDTPAVVMLTSSIGKSYIDKQTLLCSKPEVTVLAAGKENSNAFGRATVVSISGDDFALNPLFQDEIFGPFSMIIKCKSINQIEQLLTTLHGQLSVTFMGTDRELKENATLVAAAREKAGRVLFNGVPTGVEVDYAIQHGGPYPATNDSRFTSIGADAIKRFVRPICFQNAPEFLLPPELTNNNPLSIWRKIDGQMTKDVVR